MKRFILFLVYFLCMSGVVRLGAKESSYHSTTRLGDETRVFKTSVTPGLRLHIYYPKERDPDQLYPAIVIFFGGGWRHGDPTQFTRQAAHFAAKGMVVVLPEYRTRKSHSATPFDAIEDGRDAMLWVRSYAAELGVNPNRIAAAGGSAGGHVAAATAFIHPTDGCDTKALTRWAPDALILFNPVVDTTSTGYGEELMEGRPKAASPLHGIREGGPPTVIFHGEADTIVPFENVERFRDEMSRHHNTCKLYGYSGVGHGFYRKSKYFGDVMLKADEFLEQLGWLE